jgi:penicillin-binding protein 1A
MSRNGQKEAAPSRAGRRSADTPFVTVRDRRLSPLRRALIATTLGLALLAVLAAAQVYRYVFADLPQLPATEAQLWSLNRPPGVAFYDRNGALIATRGPRHGTRVALADLPRYAPQAFLAAEDRRFYSHRGVDWRGVGRALVENWQAGRTVQGGSTLTQQLVKIVLLTPEQSLKRKLQEAVLATRLERRLSKEQILTLYLHRAYFGEGAYGIESASRTYFGKTAKGLTLSEAALLAALPKAPSRLDPTNGMGEALQRSRLILRLMRQEGWITPGQEQAALAAPPKLSPPPGGEGDFGYILDLAAQQARELIPANTPDINVQLTVDPRLQSAAVQVIRQGMRGSRRRFGADQAALVALAPDGTIRALVGGVDHRQSPYNRAVQARRQPGSAFKPLVFAAALETGVSPTDVRIDAPIRFGRWAPKNYGGGYQGAMTVETALVRSRNTIAVKLADETGPDKIGAFARRLGITTVPERPYLSVALGAYEVTLLELTGAYQAFQLGGRRPPSVGVIDRITTTRGDLLYARAPSAPIPVMDPLKGVQMIRMMKGVIQRGTGKDAAIGRPAAGKTGTTQDWRDAWFIGFTPDWVAGVWVGNDDDDPTRKITGGDLPAVLWRRFMLEAHQGLPVRDFDGLAPERRDLEQRDQFYAELAAEFAREAGEGAGSSEQAAGGT